MHRSRLSTLMIDCLDSEFEASLAFWSEALGFRPPRRPAARQRYVTLGRLDGPLFVRLQKVAEGPGYHFDIETDDIRAEVARLEAAGARSSRHVKRWWVANDPSGNAFCVIRPESDAMSSANRWEAER